MKIIIINGSPGKSCINITAYKNMMGNKVLGIWLFARRWRKAPGN